MRRKTHNPEALFNSVPFGFSQIAMGRGTAIVTFSGQVAWDTDMNIIGKDDLKAQTMQTLRNLDTAIKSVDGTLDDVLSLRLYIVAHVMDDSDAITAGLTAFFPTTPPTATWIGVPRLANKDFLIEIEALAVLDTP